MQLHIILQAIWTLIKWINHKVHMLTKALISNLLRYLFFLGNPAQMERGFILPTTVLLLLVVTLAVGSITLRTLNRTGQVISDREQRIIYNAATPTLDRAKAKMEFLFDGQRNRFYPNGIPEQDELYEMMLSEQDGSYWLKFQDAAGTERDPYTFPDLGGSYDSAEAETRIDIDNDGTLDNAWSYRIDLNEDGELDATVAYSLLFNKPASNADTQLSDASDEAIAARAELLQVRHGPLSIPVIDEGCGSAGSAADEGNGWSKPLSGGSTSYKNFQVNAFVLPDDPANTVATLEFHQDRKIDEGNKWGAWFRNDLEIFPGAEFNWNGAMHTEGSFFVGNSNVEGFLISSPASCYYSRGDSEITVADRTTAIQDNNFEGQFLSARVVDNKWDDDNRSVFHLFKPDGNITNDDKKELRISNDSVDEDGSSSKPADYLLDPVVLLTQDISKARNFPSTTDAEDGNPSPGRDATWNDEGSDFVKEGRLYNETEETPSVDDSFRADNRYGPKSRVKNEAIPGKIGESILDTAMVNVTQDELINLGVDADENYNNVGLDGYWERRARAEGARVFVGQRLELGNPFGWGGGMDQNGNYIDDLAQEPLMPWAGCDVDGNTNISTRCSEIRQNRTLRDNLAAVQAAAVYHASESGGDPDFPVACLASTVHPGTPATLQSSATFLDWTEGLDDANGYWSSADLPDFFISDFFRGEGTNGWEYETPAGGSPAAFGTAVGATQPLGKVLRNLANFAGDPHGGAPSFTPQQDTLVHPYPLLSMWGDFSILRRIFDDELDAGVSYDNLSPADKTTLQTAACSMGMLANELWLLEQFNYDNAPRDGGIAGTARYGINDGHTLLDVLNARLVALSLYKDAWSDEDYEKEVKKGLGLADGDDLPEYWAEPPLDQQSGDYDYYQDATTLGDRFDGLGVNANTDPEAYIARLEQWREADRLVMEAGLRTEFNVDDDLVNLAKIIMLREQTIRDRSWGFRTPAAFTRSPNCMISGLVGTPTSPGPFRSDAYGNAFGISDVLRDNTGLFALCSQQPKFGALYSVFPGDQIQINNNDSVITAADDHNEQAAESRGLTGTEDTYTTLVSDLNPTATVAYTAIANNDLDAIRLEPVAPANWNLPKGDLGAIVDDEVGRANPLFGRDDPGNANAPDALRITCNVRLCSATGNPGSITVTNPPDGLFPNVLYRTQTMDVAFKDAGMYNGRELMSVRVMDVDLDMLRQSDQSLAGSDRWLPNSGIFYAFREDAAREDSITRRSQAAWDDCDNDAAFAEGASSCHMDNLDDRAEDATDPPLNADNFISPKPVDYAPDPDRRPNGFRLRNGDRLQRPNDEGKGLSFITDNPLYIKGNFNRHQNNAGTNLEEFSDHLLYTGTANTFSKFYDRKVKNEAFATLDGDEWRPSELLADSITILSDNFCDGSMFDFFQGTHKNKNRIEVVDAEDDNGRQIKDVVSGSIDNVDAPWRSLYNCAATGENREQTSYTNGALPKITPSSQKRQQGISLSGFEEYWHHENPYDTTSPYGLTRQGGPRMPSDATTAYSGDYFKRQDRNPRMHPIRSVETTVNAIIISGTIPSRPGQPYGGLHNFPRFLENWEEGGSLKILGSLVQLNFSHTSVGPYDQDAWEPGEEPNAGSEYIGYYLQPDRLWGYDVGLQKGVAGPMAKRFVSGAEPTRSEFYSEPPADDPYIYNLCQAIADDPGDCDRNPPLT